MNSIIEDEIVCIEEVGVMETLDICVSGDNLFFANDILTHNSEYDVGEPSLKSLSESYGMGATADFIAGVYQQDEDSENGIIRMGIMKNRFGPNFGNNSFSIDYSTLTIIEDEELNSLTTEAEDSLNTLNLLQD